MEEVGPTRESTGAGAGAARRVDAHVSLGPVARSGDRSRSREIDDFARRRRRAKHGLARECAVPVRRARERRRPAGWQYHERRRRPIRRKADRFGRARITARFERLGLEEKLRATIVRHDRESALAVGATLEDLHDVRGCELEGQKVVDGDHVLAALESSALHLRERRILRATADIEDERVVCVAARVTGARAAAKRGAPMGRSSR